MTEHAEIAVVIRAGDDELFGVLHPAGRLAETGVVILVGGPSYRVGSHRVFVQVARELARRNLAVLRFDFAGMGDSGGSFPGFEHADRDVRAALDALSQRCPALRRFVLLGLCDGATAAAFYAPTDARVAAVALLNPWVHTDVGEAKTYLWHYYPRRLLQRDFWHTFLRGKVEVGASIRDFFVKVARVVQRRAAGADPAPGFVDRMRESLHRFHGHLLVALSERDHTARQFEELWMSDRRWDAVRRAARVVTLKGADHTLSAREDVLRFCGEIDGWLETELQTAKRLAS